MNALETGLKYFGVVPALGGMMWNGCQQATIMRGLACPTIN